MNRSTSLNLFLRASKGGKPGRFSRAPFHLCESMRLRKDPKLRRALYGLYQALFRAKQLAPLDFKDSRLTTIQTAVMGVENSGWRVVGITPEALKLLARVDFRKERVPRQLCRGHIVNRVQTTRRLFNRPSPLGKNQFFEVFLANDRTVIMLVTQNKLGVAFPSYIPIRNPNAELFPNAGMIGWKHRSLERGYLRELRRKYQMKRCRLIAGKRSY
jgi:hypothetical protein